MINFAEISGTYLKVFLLTKTLFIKKFLCMENYLEKNLIKITIAFNKNRELYPPVLVHRLESKIFQ